MVHLKLNDAKTGEEILPVWWEDNYFELFPGEKREVGVSYPGDREPGTTEVEAWNAPTVSR